MYTFVPNKSFSQLLDISPKKCLFLKALCSEFPYIELWFTNRNSNPLEIEDKINITLVNNKIIKSLAMRQYSVQPGDRIFIKCYGFFSFARNMGQNVGKNISQNLCGKYS